MRQPASARSPVHSSPAMLPCRALLCRVQDIDPRNGFGDLTVRCFAHGDGRVEVLDLMFNSLDVQILASALAEIPLVTAKPGDGVRCDSSAALSLRECSRADQS
jgi:hypothetical protein